MERTGFRLATEVFFLGAVLAASVLFSDDSARWRIVRLDPRFDSLVPLDAAIEPVAEDHRVRLTTGGAGFEPGQE